MGPQARTTTVLWLVLIYTLPAAPTRKRAFVWRELKKLGAVYLRDGVCLVPDRPATRPAMRALVDRVRGYDGQATLIEAASLDPVTASHAVQDVRAARQAEFAEVAASCRELLGHVDREARHRDLPPSELKLLEADLAKLSRWAAQIRARDYFSANGSTDAVAALDRCRAALLRVAVPAVAG
jgi:hypothetical protein